MRQELQKLLFEYRKKLISFADDADFLTESVKKEMQSIYLKQFRNELKLIAKRQKYIDRGTNKFQKLVNKVLRREVNEEARAIRQIKDIDFEEAIEAMQEVENDTSYHEENDENDVVTTEASDVAENITQQADTAVETEKPQQNVQKPEAEQRTLPQQTVAPQYATADGTIYQQVSIFSSEEEEN